MHNELQDVMGQSFGVPDDIDESDLMGELDALEDELAAEAEAHPQAGGVPSYLQVGVVSGNPLRCTCKRLASGRDYPGKAWARGGTCDGQALCRASVHLVVAFCCRSQTCLSRRWGAERMRCRCMRAAATTTSLGSRLCHRGIDQWSRVEWLGTCTTAHAEPC